MSQISSLPLPTQSVSRVLTADMSEVRFCVHEVYHEKGDHP
jgi:hypothetical protein